MTVPKSIVLTGLITQSSEFTFRQVDQSWSEKRSAGLAGAARANVFYSISARRLMERKTG
jgi:hypothetical protein